MADQTFAVNSGFYDAVNSDRTYSADDMNRPYKRLVSNGVFATPQGTKSTDLQVVAAGGMQIIVKEGEGIFADKWFENPAAINITVPSNTSTSPRIDSVIVQVDKRTSGRVGNIVYRTGTPSSNPSAPAINTTSDVIEYRLANIRVAAGAVSITGGVITDRRGSSDCPWITSLIYQVDTSTLYDQWAAAYKEYFEAEKAMWDDWYSHLTEELDVSLTLVKRSNTVVTTSDTSEIEIGIADFNINTDLLEVYINGLKAIEGVQYTINGNTSIFLTAPVTAGQVVSFVVLKSVILGNEADIMSMIDELEERIDSIGDVTPTVVDNVSDMTDTDKIYILSTDSKWYYYDLTSSEWTIGGTYGGVSTDSTLTQSGMAADAKAVGDEISEVKTSIDTQIDVNSFDLKSNYNVYPNKNDTIVYTGFDLISRRKNYIEFNGSTTSSLLRFAIFNDSQTKVSSTAPSYANRPAWYNAIDNFVVGHKYYFGVKLLSGSYEWTGTTPLDNFIDVRTKDDGILYQSRNSEWICTVKPEMICFSIGKGSYQNAVFELSIIDTTDFGENDIAGKKVYELSETVEEMEQIIELTASDVEKLQDTTLMPIRHAIKDSTASKLKLFFFTDVHADAIAINNLLDYVQSHEGWIDEVINGGDTARYEFSSGANSNYFDSDLASMALSVIGNHDSAVYDSNNNIDWWGKTQKEVYDRYLAPYISNWDVIQPANASTLGLNYYYKDYDTIRIIYLDAVFWDSDQLSWFEDVLSDASSDDMSVIIVAHGTDGSFTGDTDCNWTWIEKPDETGYYSNMKFNGGASSAVNTFITNGGDFICWLTGHTHFDRIGHMANYPDQFAITMNNAGTKTSDSRGAFYSGTMVIVDKTNTLIKLIRCGCTYDSYLKPKHTLCYNYSTQELISQT